MGKKVSNEKGSGPSWKDTESVKVQQAPSGQLAMQELLTQDQAGGVQDHNLKENVGHENFDQSTAHDEQRVEINSVYMQPDREGSFALVKKEFVNTIQTDKIVTQNIIAEATAEATKTNDPSFNKNQHLQPTHNATGSELNFTKINFGNLQDNLGSAVGKASIEGLPADNAAKAISGGVNITIAPKATQFGTKAIAAGTQSEVPKETPASTAENSEENAAETEIEQTTSSTDSSTTNTTETVSSTYVPTTETTTTPTVTITPPIITPIIIPPTVINNNAPIVAAVNKSMQEDSTIIITNTELLANATDVENSALTVTNVYSNNRTVVNNNNGS